MPEGINVRVQTGPAISGTELRDATGDLDFGQFTNQIEFQDAGAALNEEMKEQVIEPVDVDGLEGETVTITGAFTAVHPEAWLVTPATMEVESTCPVQEPTQRPKWSSRLARRSS